MVAMEYVIVEYYVLEVIDKEGKRRTYGPYWRFKEAVNAGELLVAKKKAVAYHVSKAWEIRVVK